MSNFFVKSLKDKKNTNSNNNSPFNSGNFKKYKKSIEHKDNLEKDKEKNKKKFMITPPNENLYRKKNIEHSNTFEKSPELNPLFSKNINTVNSFNTNKENYKKSPHKIIYSTSPTYPAYSTDLLCTLGEVIYDKEQIRDKKKVLNSSDIQNVLLDNISNSPNMFNIIDKKIDELEEKNEENSSIIKMSSTCFSGTTVLNTNSTNSTNLKTFENISNVNNENIDNTKDNEKYTYINKLNFSSLQKEPTVTLIQKDKIKLYNYNIMLDTYTNKFLECSNENISNEQKIPCYYCRRRFNNAPIGLPICYYPSIYVIKNNTQNLKYSFNYKENTVKLNSNEKERLLKILERTSSNNDFNIFNKNLEFEEEKNCISGFQSFVKDIHYQKKNKKNEKIEDKESHQILTKQFFETEGVFCSFNCIVSYLEDNRNNPLYQNSYNLVYFMYKMIFGEFPNFNIVKSPSWKLRNEYGGPLSDEDYEKYIQNIPIIDSNQLKYCIYKHESVYEVLV
jgi:hypothetical protein